ncbi:MAG: hypothetical protein ACI9P5_004575 [Saprospiraceae bacterium]|jgi:hypothetical protein
MKVLWFQYHLMNLKCYVNLDLKVQFSKVNTNRQMTVLIDDGEPIISHEFTPPNHSASSLQEFTGEYFSPELNTTYKAVLNEDKLPLTHARASDVIISAAKSDMFILIVVSVLNLKGMIINK